MNIVLAVKWRPLSEAPKDSECILVYVPDQSHSLQTLGLFMMRWSGWGGGVWEATTGWRPLESDLAGAVWTDPAPIAASAKAA